MGKSLTAWVDIDADSLPQNQLHVGRMAKLYHYSYCQVHPLLRPRPPATELGAFMDGGVPRRLCFHLRGRQTRLVNETAPIKDSRNSSENDLMQVHPHLSVVVFDNLQVKEVILIFPSQGGIPASSLRNLKLVLRAEVIGWRKKKNNLKHPEH